MTIDFHTTGAIAHVVLDRPEKMNALSSTMYREIDAAFAEIDADPAIRVAIVTGTGGRAFSAGADLTEMHASDTPARGWGPWRPDGWGFGRTTRKPLIAAIDGFALAGGLELAMTCDIRIATPNSQFGAPEARWALLHGLGATRLPGAIGMSNTMMLLLTGDRIDAESALRMGLVSELVPSADLAARALEVATRISENDPMAVQMIKEIARQAGYSGEDSALRLYRSYYGLLETSPHQAGAIQQFTARSK
jgi:E-phenylitaconyl-CoA hydratase